MTDPSPPSRRSALRNKLPELIVEGFSVALAVLLALAVDEWRENRGNLQLADRAEASIQAEINLNRERLEDGAAARDSLLGYLRAVQDTLEGGTEPSGINVKVSPALLGRTAWETAQVTRAIHFMDYDRVARIGRLYEFQGIYEESEDELVDLVAGIGTLNWDEPLEPVGMLMTAMVRVDLLADNLAGAYRDMEACEFGVGECPDDAPEDTTAAGTADTTAAGAPGRAPEGAGS